MTCNKVTCISCTDFFSKGHHWRVAAPWRSDVSEQRPLPRVPVEAQFARLCRRRHAQHGAEALGGRRDPARPLGPDGHLPAARRRRGPRDDGRFAAEAGRLVRGHPAAATDVAGELGEGPGQGRARVRGGHVSRARGCPDGRGVEAHSGRL